MVDAITFTAVRANLASTMVSIGIFGEDVAVEMPGLLEVSGGEGRRVVSIS